MAATSHTVIPDGDLLVEKDVPILPLLDGHILCCNVFRPNGDRHVDCTTTVTGFLER
jgi:hypothetical protein